MERYFGIPSETAGGQGLLAAYEIMKETNQLLFVRAQTTAAANSECDLLIGALPMVVAGTSATYTEFRTPNVFNAAMTGSTTSGSAHFVVQVYNSDGVATTTKPYFLSVAHPSGVDVVVSGFQKTLSDNPDFVVEKLDDDYLAFVGQHAGVNSKIAVSAFCPREETTDAFSTTQLSGHGAVGGGGNLLSKTDSGTYIQFDGTKVGVKNMTLGADAKPGLISGTDIVADTGMDVTGMMFVSAMFYDSGNNYLTAALSEVSGGTYRGQPYSKNPANNGLEGSGATLSRNEGAGGAYTLRAMHTGKGNNAASSYNGNANVVRGLSVRVLPLGKYQQSITLMRNGSVEESYKVQLVESTINSGTPTWPSSVINTKTYGNGNTSDYVYGAFEDVDGDTAVTWTAPTTITSPAYVTSFSLNGLVESAVLRYTRFLKFIEKTYDMSGGANGDASDHGGDLSHSEVVNAMAGPTGTLRGVKAFTPDSVDVDIVTIPGVHVQEIQTAAINAAESNGKFIYITSPPEGLSPQEAVDWHNGNYPGRTTSMNSSYAALYYPHCKFFNTWTGVDQYADPAIFATKAMAKADNIADVWVATAGVSRGKISPTVKELERDLNQGDRDYIYGGGNSLNPIVNFRRHGICLWGQRTTQRVATALDRINVRRLAIAIRQKVSDLGMPFVFEPNDPITWSLIVGEIEPMLEDILARRGIRSFKVFCDETTNTPLRVDRGELWVKVEVVPTKSAESLIFEINVLGQEEA